MPRRWQDLRLRRTTACLATACLALVAAPSSALASSLQSERVVAWPNLDHHLDLRTALRAHDGDDPSYARARTDGPGWTDAPPQGGDDDGGIAFGPIAWLSALVELGPKARLDIEHGAALSLVLGTVNEAAEVYVDGELVARVGQVAPRHVADIRSSWALPIDARLLRGKQRFRLALRTSEPSGYGSRVLSGPVAIARAGEAEVLAQASTTLSWARVIAPAIVFSLILLGVALVHLWMWWRRRSLLPYLPFGQLMLLTSAWGVLGNFRAGIELVGLSPDVAMIMLLGLPLIICALLLRFVAALGGEAAPSRWTLWGERSAYVVAALVLVDVQVVEMGMATAAPLWIAALFLLAIVQLALLWRRGVRAAPTILLGVAAVFASVILATARVSISPFILVYSGFLLFALSMVVALSDDFLHSMAHLDALNGRLREMLAAANRFVPYPFLELLGRRDLTDVRRGDQTEIDAAVLFADVRGFTTLSERLGPARTFALINDFLADMEPLIAAHGGVIAAYLGDGFMAVFEGSAGGAIEAAVAMQRALERFNERQRPHDGPELAIGVGINTGRTVLGTLGSEERIDCTLISDAVNLAARIEGMTKQFGARVLVTGAALATLAPDVAARWTLREVGRVLAKGKREPTRVIEVLEAQPDAIRARRSSHLPAFAAAMDAYVRGAFSEAQAGFEALQREDPDDLAASAYAESAAELAAGPPPADWAGVLVLRSK